MATNLDLVNRALMELGNAKVLTSDELTAANTSPAKTMAAAYPTAISDVLSRFDFYSTRRAHPLLPPDDVMFVEGAGTAQVNGFYLRVEDQDNRPRYVSNQGTSIQGDAVDIPQWIIVTLTIGGYTTQYAILSNALTPDLTIAEDWVGDPITQGALPTPTVRRATWPEAFTAGVDPSTLPLIDNSTTPYAQFKYSIPLPEDLEVFRFLSTAEGCRVYDYRLEGDRILVNDKTLYIHYTHSVTDVSLLPNYLFVPIVFYLASLVAKPLTGEMSERDRMMQYYEDALRKAKTRASQEQVPQTLINPNNSGFLQAHHGYGNL